MVHYRPVEHAYRLKVPTLVLDVDKEELSDIKQNGGLAYESIKKNAPAKCHVFPGLKQYNLYSAARREAVAMAVDWVNKFPKGDFTRVGR
jgi:hypothetical protein